MRGCVRVCVCARAVERSVGRFNCSARNNARIVYTSDVYFIVIGTELSRNVSEHYELTCVVHNRSRGARTHMCVTISQSKTGLGSIPTRGNLIIFFSLL